MWAKIGICLALVGAGCTSGQTIKEDSPQKILSEYVALTFAVKSPADKERLLAYTTDDARKHLEQLSEADFDEYFLQSKKEFISLRIKEERKLPSDRYSITYEITYLSKGPTLDPATNEPLKNQIINKKNAIFAKKDTKWQISSVQNIKTLIEPKEPMSF